MEIDRRRNSSEKSRHRRDRRRSRSRSRSSGRNRIRHFRREIDSYRIKIEDFIVESASAEIKTIIDKEVSAYLQSEDYLAMIETGT